MRNVAVVVVGLLMWSLMGGPPAATAAVTPQDQAAAFSTSTEATPESADLPHTVTGEFVSYAPEDQEVTVRDDNDEELIFTVDPNALPSLNDQTVAFDRLRAGDRVTLTVADDENGDEYVTAIAVARAPSP